MRAGDWIALAMFVSGCGLWLWVAQRISHLETLWHEVAKANREYARAIALSKIGLYDEAQRVLEAADARRTQKVK